MQRQDSLGDRLEARPLWSPVRAFLHIGGVDDLAEQHESRIAGQLVVLHYHLERRLRATCRKLSPVSVEWRRPALFDQQDADAIDKALAQTEMTEHRHRRLDSLSGGERQRAWIALALAQATPMLLLDEPTTFLDIGHQVEVLDLIRQLNREHGMTIVLVLHDLNQAARYAGRMVVLNHGQIVADGTPAAVLTPDLLAEVFQVRAYVLTHPADGVPYCLPYGSLPQ